MSYDVSVFQVNCLMSYDVSVFQVYCLVFYDVSVFHGYCLMMCLYSMSFILLFWTVTSVLTWMTYLSRGDPLGFMAFHVLMSP